LVLNGEDISDRIRSPEISMLASAVSARPVVRQALLGIQREVGKNGGLVAEGRDMGTVVFPQRTSNSFWMPRFDSGRCDVSRNTKQKMVKR
jgi:cytidylate kinase